MLREEPQPRCSRIPGVDDCRTRDEVVKRAAIAAEEDQETPESEEHQAERVHEDADERMQGVELVAVGAHDPQADDRHAERAAGLRKWIRAVEDPPCREQDRGRDGRIGQVQLAAGQRRDDVFDDRRAHREQREGGDQINGEARQPGDETGVATLQPDVALGGDVRREGGHVADDFAKPTRSGGPPGRERRTPPEEPVHPAVHEGVEADPLAARRVEHLARDARARAGDDRADLGAFHERVDVDVLEQGVHIELGDDLVHVEPVDRAR